MRWFANVWLWLQTAALFRAADRQRPDLHVVLYTRANCPLCDEAAILLDRYRRRHGFTLETRDVDASPELVAAHGNWVPVVTINGQLRFRGHINEVLLQRILDAKNPPMSNVG